jgi:hypothetical protein
VIMNTSKLSAANQSNAPHWWSRELPDIEAAFDELVLQNFNGHDDIIKKVQKAKQVAQRIHAGQVREGGGDYLIHPLRVAISIMSELGLVDEVLIKAALLHDVLEDSNVQKDELATEFGNPTANLVVALSRRPEEKRPPQGDSPESPYFKRICEAGEHTLVLKTADKLDNLRDALYHPNSRKRRVYVEEVDKVFVPLFHSLPDNNLWGKLKALLRDAADSHSLKSLIALIDKQTRGVGQGERVIVPPAGRAAPLLYYLLFNPKLKCWLSDDGIQLTKTQPSATEIAANVARKYAQFIEAGRVSELLECAGIRTPLGNTRNQRHWNRAVAQLQELSQLLQKESPPPWCAPTLEPDSAHWLLLTVHSVLWRPANWIFPMWHDIYGETLAKNLKKSPYAHSLAQSDILLCHQFLCFLLTSREALWRFSTGTGRRARAESVFEASASVSGISREVLWSARLLSEYLDVIVKAEGSVQGSVVAAKFTKIWDALKKDSFQPGTLSKLATRQLVESDVEFLGLEEVREMFRKAKQAKEFNILRNLLINHCNTETKSSTRWISFDISEFRKRRPELFKELNLDEFSRFADLEKCGILSRAETDGETFILKIFPARRFAIQNRLPELSPTALKIIEADDYSATAIFDTLIGERLNRPEKVWGERVQDILTRTKASMLAPLADLDADTVWHPRVNKILDSTKDLMLNSIKDLDFEAVWVPRVYRILDTLEDLDPKNVQVIDIELRGTGEPAKFRTYLPLPRQSDNLASDESLDHQKERKKILTRYIVTQIYNYGITRCIVSVNVECALLEAARAAYGFTNESLMAMIQSEEKALGFRSGYGNFIESFNFSPFRISGVTASQANLPFGETDMRSGLFLGIDIGGTDVKFALFTAGKATGVDTGKSLGKIKTFPDQHVEHIDAEAFCTRLVSEIFQRLGNSKDIYSQLSGIGISWPGAVRENRIACISGTLAKLKYQQNSFSFTSPPTAIHAFPFLDLFHKALDEFARQNGFQPDRNLALILENDGNAEAFGNYCSRVLEKQNKPGGKLIVKLGTSLAGGRVRPDSSVADDVAEFSKIVLNLNLKGSELNSPQGVARDYVSSLGVRNLSRTFPFQGKPLFGTRGTENTENTEEKKATATRIEAVELGELLSLWRAGVTDQDYQDYLSELVRTDNQPGPPACNKLVKRFQKSLRDGSLNKQLIAYIEGRGKEWSSRYPKAPADGKSNWQKGLERLHWLCTGQQTDNLKITGAELPKRFPVGDLAKKTLGTVALFSQLGLQIAHLVAALYNIYRRDSFNEIILAGGVLSGLTGELVKGQAEKFLLKYYDKIYGAGKNLPPNALQLAQSENRELAGPLGVAMLANRAHKEARLKALRRLVDFLIGEMEPGNLIGLSKVESELRKRRISASRSEVLAYLLAKVAESVLIPQKDGKTFIKAVEASS